MPESILSQVFFSTFKSSPKESSAILFEVHGFNLLHNATLLEYVRQDQFIVFYKSESVVIKIDTFYN